MGGLSHLIWFMVVNYNVFTGSIPDWKRRQLTDNCFTCIGNVHFICPLFNMQFSVNVICLYNNRAKWSVRTIQLCKHYIQLFREYSTFLHSRLAHTSYRKRPKTLWVYHLVWKSSFSTTVDIYWYEVINNKSLVSEVNVIRDKR